MMHGRYPNSILLKSDFS